MNKYFVSYESALALKELGFDEECFRSYVKDTKELTTRMFANFYRDHKIKAPIFQQAFSWLLSQEAFESGTINVALYPDGTYSIKDGEVSLKEYLTPDECIRELIEIAKS